MGFISDIVTGSKEFPGQEEGGRLWRQVFGQATDKETPHKPRPKDSNSWSRSNVSGPESFKRLLQAFRSMAPGGWSDDRFEQTTKHFIGIAYIAIHRIATQWQQAEFQIFRKDRYHPDGKRPITQDDPPEGDRMQRPWDLVKLLERPNRRDYFGKLMYRWCQNKYLTGTALTWMVPNELGCPMEMYCIPTAMAIPQPVINAEYPDGFYRIQPLYPYGPFSSYPTPATAVGAPVPAKWMLRFQYPHPLLQYEGYAPLTGLRLNLDVIESIYRSRWYSMKRSINPSAVLNMEEMEGSQPLPWEEIERIRAEFESSVQGTENAGQLFVPTPGTKLEPWGGRPIDMDYGTGWDQETSFALAGFGLTKPAAGMIEDSSYATLFATMKQIHVLTLKPDMDDIGAELTAHLAPYFGDDLIVEVRCPRIDDHDLKNAKLDKLMAGKAIKKNELRKELDMPPTKEKWGDEFAGEGGQEQQQMPGMPGQPGQKPEEPTKMEPANADMEAANEEANQEREETPEKEVERTMPSTGPLGRGALGPRKALSKAFVNGNGKKHA